MSIWILGLVDNFTCFVLEEDLRRYLKPRTPTQVVFSLSLIKCGEGSRSYAQNNMR